MGKLSGGMGNAPGRGVPEKYVQRIPSRAGERTTNLKLVTDTLACNGFVLKPFQGDGLIAFLSCGIREKMGSESASLHQPLTNEGGGDIRKKRTLRTGNCPSRNHRWQ